MEKKEGAVKQVEQWKAKCECGLCTVGYEPFDRCAGREVAEDGVTLRKVGCGAPLFPSVVLVDDPCEQASA